MPFAAMLAEHKGRMATESSEVITLADRKMRSNDGMIELLYHR